MQSEICCFQSISAEMDRRLRQYCSKYVDYISKNAETTADVEVLVKYLSYFVSGN